MRLARIGNFLVGSSDSKFRWRRSLKRLSFVRERVAKLELPRVQHMTRKAAAPTVERISEHRVAEMLQVHPNLMRAPSARAAFD